MKLKQSILVICSVVLVTGCASNAVKPTYVSPSQYQNYDCSQLSSEFTRIQQYIDGGVQTPKSKGVGVGVGLSGGWGSGGWGWGIGPSVSVSMGQSSNSKKTELSRLYGQQDAISQAAQFKNCAYVPKRSTAKAK
ncbi:hypothetical protein [Acinetobacter larvae]|uniref:Lipoprotein n=1 Tax=Acinetobacter larvae TaxID=1789224 RepID=A0A1B2LX10_9GAMM|nr:hypothetical protein [Acinetobacter larvae]AOA57313.1 hypothetical protein BFG52_02365 [Acinetobacter larvae]